MPNKVRTIILKNESNDVEFCKAFFLIIVKAAGDNKKKALGESPDLSDDTLVEITDILTGEVDDPNKVAALQGAGITNDIIEDLV